MHRLRTDKQNSEMLNYVPSYETSDKSQIQSKRTKRDNNRKTDDAPEVSSGKENIPNQFRWVRLYGILKKV